MHFGLVRRPPRSQTWMRSPNSSTSQAAFLMQKGIYEYSRARAGHYAKVMFARAGVHGCLRPLALAAPIRSGWPWSANWWKACCVRIAGADRGEAARDGLRALVLSVFDSYPVPASARRAGVERGARRAGAAAAARRPASAQAGHGHSRAAREDLFRPDAHPREAARPRLSHHAQLPQGHHVQHPRRADEAHGCAGAVATLAGAAAG